MSLPSLGLARTYGARDLAEYEALLPGLTGYVTAVAAKKGAVDLASSLDAVRQALLEYEQRTGIRIEDRIESKRWAASVS
jgi:hypothetical protein